MLGLIAAGSIILGVSTIDGAATDVLVISPDGREERALTIDHAPGRIPKGVLDGNRLITVSVVPDETGTVVDEFDFATSTRRTIGTGAIPLQAPSADGFVRQVKEGEFEIVARGVPPRKREASWVKPFADNAFLEITLDGNSRIIDGKRIHELGKARVRSPAKIGSDIVMEREGEVVDVKGRVLHKGLPGMDPIALGDRVVLGAGTKSAKVLVARVQDGKLRDVVTLEAVVARPSADAALAGAEARATGTHLAEARATGTHRAGIATPKAAAMINGQPVVVAWIDRGASLPGELWLLTTTGGRQLVTSGAVEVYGVAP
jgi:hypothetical protein